MKILLDFSLWQQSPPADPTVSKAVLARIRQFIRKVSDGPAGEPIVLLDGSRPATTEALRFAFADLLPPASICTCWLVTVYNHDPAIHDINCLLRRAYVDRLAPNFVFHPLHEDAPCDDISDSLLGESLEYILSLSNREETIETCLLDCKASAIQKKAKTLPRKLSSIDDLVTALHEALRAGFARVAKPEHVDTILMPIIARSLGNKDSVLVSECAWALANNLRPSGKPILYVDISGIVRREIRTGIDRVTRGILTELLKMSDIGYSIQPIVANDYELGYRHAGAFLQRAFGLLADSLSDTPIAPRPGDRFMGLDFDTHITCVQEPFLRYLHLHGLNIHFLVHDLLPVTNPEWFPSGVQDGHTNWLKIISRFSGAVCVSRTVAEKLAAWRVTNLPELSGRPFRITFSHNAADIKNTSPSTGVPHDAEKLLETWRSRSTFLMVGTIEPRKGYRQILKTFELMWGLGHDLNLIIVGKQGWHMEDFTHEIQQSRYLNRTLFWPSNVSDEFLEKIYSVTTCLIAASEDEGFGLPLIEAAMHNIPLFVRDIPIFREVAGSHAYYFKATTAEGTALDLKAWLSLRQNALEPSSRGITYLTWAKSAESLLRAIDI